MNEREAWCSTWEILLLPFNAEVILCQTSVPPTHERQEGLVCEEENGVENLAEKKKPVGSSPGRTEHISYTVNN